MKKLLLIPLILLSGCASTDPLYWDASKSISRDITVSQSACWAAVGEIAKGGDNSVKTAAIALAEKCKSETVKLQQPKKGWLGF